MEERLVSGVCIRAQDNRDEQRSERDARANTASECTSRNGSLRLSNERADRVTRARFARACVDQRFHTIVRPLVRLNVSGWQNAAALRYQAW